MLSCPNCQWFGHTVDNCTAHYHRITGANLWDQKEFKRAYVLRLQNGKFYVGSSVCPRSRLQQHLHSIDAPEWTKLNPPIELIDGYCRDGFYMSNPKGCMEQDEFYSQVYAEGVDNVRGWLYANPVLTNEARSEIERQVCAHFNLCYKCGHSSHQSSSCYATKKAEWMNGRKYRVEDEFHA